MDAKHRSDVKAYRAGLNFLYIAWLCEATSGTTRAARIREAYGWFRGDVEEWAGEAGVPMSRFPRKPFYGVWE